MNANEVIANRAIQILGGEVGSKSPVHPNDHVNFGQSSNDVFPTAIHVAALPAVEKRLIPALCGLHDALGAKARQFDGVVKIGRTHLQDATPIRLGQELSGYASQVEHGLRHLEACTWHLRELPIGGTAVGTGLNTHREFGGRMASRLAELTGVQFVEAPNHFEAHAARDAAVQCSGALKTLAAALIKIANDIRFLASGPRLGLGELELPAVQPGSSIMPGKVNPVIAESLIQACGQVVANDLAVVQGGQWGFFELNTMMPLVGYNLLGSIELLGAATRNFAESCVRGLAATERGAEMVERSLALATALVPLIGYDAAAEIAKEAARSGRTVREVARERAGLTDEQLVEALDPSKMTGRS
jgi:fumarate hydratase class II